MAKASPTWRMAADGTLLLSSLCDLSDIVLSRSPTPPAAGGLQYWASNSTLRLGARIRGQPEGRRRRFGLPVGTLREAGMDRARAGGGNVRGIFQHHRLL